MKREKQLVDNRRLEIMKLLQQNKIISVNELADQFGVSKVTVRRDLQYWEDMGALKRDYGGASLVQNFIDDHDNYQRKRYLHAIAKAAASYIDDGDVIFLNTSLTALAILEYIRGKNVTVITNNARAIGYTPDGKVTVIFTGGEVKYPKNSMTGDYAVSMLNNISAVKCFIGCSGLDLNGIYTSIMREISVNQTMIRRTTGQRFLVCSHKKFGLTYPFRYATLNDFNYVITDNNAPIDMITRMEERYPIKFKKVSPIGIAINE